MSSIFDTLLKFSWDKITDVEAHALYEAWKRSPSGKKLSAASGNEILSLKAKGYVAGFGDRLELTPLGERLIREMATNEPNNLEKNAKMPSYSEIKGKKASRPRQTHVAKQSKIASLNPIRPFNLRRESVLRMRGVS